MSRNAIIMLVLLSIFVYLLKMRMPITAHQNKQVIPFSIRHDFNT